MSVNETKLDVKRRLFLAAVAKGEDGTKFGFQLCPICNGKGSIEHSNDGKHWAVFEECTECNGDTFVSLDNTKT